MNDSTIEIILKAQDQASAHIKEVESQVSKLTGSTDKAGPSFISMASAVAVGQAALQAFETAGRLVEGAIKSVISAAMDEENQIAQTNAVLASTKGAAGMSSEAITELADSFARTTPFSDDVVRSSENMLLTFTKIGKDIFPQATETVLNMAQALGEDTKSASIQLGKALQDPILGVTALRRVGVDFTDDQKKVIKSLVDTGQSAKAQQMILAELTTEFGGSAKAAGQTFAGSLKVLDNNIEMMKETIGKTIITAITPFIQKLSAWASTPDAQKKVQEITAQVGEMTKKMMDWVTQVAVPWVQTHWPAIKKAVTDVYNNIKTFFDFIISQKEGIIAALTGIGVAFVLSDPALTSIGMIIAIASSSGALGWLINNKDILIGVIGGLGVAFAIAFPAITAFSAAIIIIVDAIKWIIGNSNKAAPPAMSDAQKTAMGNAFSKVSGDTGILGVNTEHASSPMDRPQAPGKSMAVSNPAVKTGSGIPGFASGVTNFSGGLAYVHEGEALVNLPKGTNVIPKNKAGGGGITINNENHFYRDSDPIAFTRLMGQQLAGR